INSGIRRFENSIYNPLTEISIYNNPEAIFTIKISDKIDKDNKILKKFIIRINKSTDYNTVSTKNNY
ncbi:hypothetical protein OFL98_30230, partial [Escherichia coli]|nr:hypothetical protein [Escherichia coli]